MRRARWNWDKYSRRPGDVRFEQPGMPQYPPPGRGESMCCDPWWTVEGMYGDDGVSPSGSVSFHHCKTLQGAQALLAVILDGGMGDERDARMTDWVIVKHAPTIVSRVIHREPVKEVWL